MVGSGDVRFQLDAEPTSEHRRRWDEIKEYEEELRQAQANNDQGRIAELTTLVDWLKRDLAAHFDRYGRERNSADPTEKARKAISNAITRSLKSIERDHKALSDHLKEAIRRGEFFKYAPAESPSWNK